MALTVDHHQPNQNYKHFCKICKKGFLCGRALGGHMRAHGIGDDSGNLDEDDGASDWEDNKLGGSTTSSPSSNKRMYALRTNPNRLRNCRICENCGKEFLSWKSFLEHGKCSSSDDVDESIVSSPGGSDYEDAVAERSTSGGWLKRKRSFRAEVEHYSTNNNSSSCPSTEEEDLANCLMMLSNAPTDPSVLTDHLELEPCTSGLATKNNHLHNLNPPINFINVAPITAMAPWAAAAAPPIHDKAKGIASSNTNSKGLFECKACKKVFNSHQALGGHRASHKKVKGCFAARLEHDHHQDGGSSLVVDYEQMVFNDELLHPPKSTPNSSANIFPSKKKAKVHECSICHRVFPSGQALGGHKRCHWITSNSPDTSTFTRYQQQIHHQDPIDIQPNELRSSTSIFNSQTQKALDLNLPAPNNIVDDPLGLKRSDSMNLLSLKVSTEFFLQSLGGSVNMKENQRLVHNIQPCIHRNQNNKDQPNNNNNKPQDSSSQNNIDDEVDSKVKLAKLSELKHINVSDNGSTTPWLQVGIGSSDGIGT